MTAFLFAWLLGVAAADDIAVGDSTIVDLNARSSNNGQTLTLGPGNYQWLPIVGTYQAWHAWGRNSGCGSLTCSRQGWQTRFSAITTLDGTLPGGVSRPLYASSALAIANTLPQGGCISAEQDVTFFIADNPHSDNLGGLSIQVTRFNETCIEVCDTDEPLDVDGDGIPDDFDGNGIADVCDCQGEPVFSDVVPVDGSEVAAGVPVLLSGRVTRVDETRPIAGVLVDGVPVDALDRAGAFWARTTLADDDRLRVVEAYDRCGSYPLTLTYDPVPVEDIETEAVRVLPDCAVDFVDTTWATDTSRLFVKASVRNTGDTPWSGPVLLGIGADLHPSISLFNLDGVRDDLPYQQVVPEGTQLAPGEATPLRHLVFDNPFERYNGFTPQCLGPANRPPVFVSVPNLTAAPSTPWTYDADATDPDEDVLTYRIVAAPQGMTIDPGTGQLDWVAPAAGGAFDVQIAADDGRGGTAEQRFTLDVRTVDNRPPVFVTAPVTTASVGGSYVYDSEAVDPDEDDLVYTLVEGPDDMAVDPDTGLIAWPFALPGAHDVTVTADDGRGGVATQSYVVTVGILPPRNGAPQIVSVPPTETRPFDLYLYPAVAIDPDDDVLTWSLDHGPAGLAIDPDSGLVDWIPPTIGDYPVGITVADPSGLSASQDWVIHVRDFDVNLPPYFVTTPPLLARVGVPYVYDSEALDPEGEVVAYSLELGPPGTFDPATGELSWTPVASDADTEVLVAIVAEDPPGLTASQVYTISVGGPNSPPTIVSPAPTTAYLGQPFLWDVDAVDPDEDPLTYSLLDAPTGMTVDPHLGYVDWTPDAPGTVTLTARAADPFLGEDTQPWVIDVLEDLTPPELFVDVPDGVCQGLPLTYCVRASDAVSQPDVDVLLDGEVAPGFGCHSVDVDGLGVHTLDVTATDGSGNTTSDAFTFVLQDCDDAEPPVVTLLAPPDRSLLWMPTDLEVSITDNNPATLTWTVEISPAGEGDWTLLESGLGEVDGPITLLDTTLLRNGDYDVRVLADDGAFERGIQPRYTVTGTYKPGRFRLVVPDGTFQIAGIGLGVERIYDSYDTEERDFGTAWALGLAGYVRDEPAEGFGTSLVRLLSAEPFEEGTRVCAVVPGDGGVERCWEFRPRNRGYPAFFAWEVVWEADACNDYTLTAEGSTTVFNYGGFYDFVAPYNPDTYYVTTDTGVRYTLHEVRGLLAIEDAYGGRVDIGPDGLAHTSGARVDFERDSQGRIDAAQFPSPDGVAPGERWTYTYDGPVLAEVRNGGELVYSYAYEDPNWPTYLTTIRDGTGRLVLRTIFDDEGRMLAQCGPEDDPVTLDGCYTFDFTDVGEVISIVDGRGATIDQFFDERGNLVLTRRFLEDGTPVDITYDFDTCDRLLSQDLDGDTWTFSWNERDQLVTLEAPGGRTWSYDYAPQCDLMAAEVSARGDFRFYEYNDFCELTDIVDAAGGRTTYTYDDAGNITSIVDASGDTWALTWSGGNLTSLQLPSGGVTTWTYDGAGRLVATTDPENRTITYTYDARGNLETETWNTTPPRVITYDWDAADLLVSAVDPDSSLTFGYHPDGQMAWQDTTGTPGATGVRLDYTYDLRRRGRGLRGRGLPRRSDRLRLGLPGAARRDPPDGHRRRQARRPDLRRRRPRRCDRAVRRPRRHASRGRDDGVLRPARARQPPQRPVAPPRRRHRRARHHPGPRRHGQPLGHHRCRGHPHLPARRPAAPHRGRRRLAGLGRPGQPPRPRLDLRA